MPPFETFLRSKISLKEIQTRSLSITSKHKIMHVYGVQFTEVQLKKTSIKSKKGRCHIRINMMRFILPLDSRTCAQLWIFPSLVLLAVLEAEEAALITDQGRCQVNRWPHYCVLALLPGLVGVPQCGKKLGGKVKPNRKFIYPAKITTT